MNTIKVLAVDDEVKIQDFIRLLLKNEGYQVETASSGEEAITQAVKYRPQLIIMDIMLPDMNGGEAVQAIKTKGLTDIPVIFLSGIAGTADEGEEKSSIKVGEQVYPAFSKPIDTRAFLAEVHKYL